MFCLHHYTKWETVKEYTTKNVYCDLCFVILVQERKCLKCGKVKRRVEEVVFPCDS